MYELDLDYNNKNEKLRTVDHHFGDRQYIVFPAPRTHDNYVNRPQKYTKPDVPKTYTGRGSNGKAKILEEIHGPANALMSAILDYGKILGDNSMISAVIGNGYREPDEAQQGVNYLKNIEMVIAKRGLKVTIPTNLASKAEGMLGDWNDPRFRAFLDELGNDKADGWTPDLAEQVLHDTANYYVPRGAFNPHATGLVFDLNFPIYHHIRKSDQKLYESEDPVDALPPLNEAALRSACGMWLNKWSTMFHFDSYNTGKEVWHMEYRKQ